MLGANTGLTERRNIVRRSVPKTNNYREMRYPYNTKTKTPPRPNVDKANDAAPAKPVMSKKMLSVSVA